jgi:Ca2+-binding EF-hand superfamily protein
MRAVLAAVLVVLALTPAHAQDAAARRFDRLAAELVPLCMRAAATRCFEAAFTLADRDGDGELAPDELDRLRRDANAWFLARRGALSPSEQVVVGMGLATVNTAGVDGVVRAYDADGDGALDRDEVTADVALDERPLPELIRDDDAIDWPAIRGRLGALAGALLPAPE